MTGPVLMSRPEDYFVIDYFAENNQWIISTDGRHNAMNLNNIEIPLRMQ